MGQFSVPDLEETNITKIQRNAQSRITKYLRKTKVMKGKPKQI